VYKLSKVVFGFRRSRQALRFPSCCFTLLCFVGKFCLGIALFLGLTTGEGGVCLFVVYLSIEGLLLAYIA
jgi:hypothetical protein